MAYYIQRYLFIISLVGGGGVSKFVILLFCFFLVRIVFIFINMGPYGSENF